MSPALELGRRLIPAVIATVLLTGGAPASADDVTECQGHPATIVGTEGDDVLSGTSGDDVIAGLGGDDIIGGRAGNDVICGGEGDDRIFGGAGTDVLVGGAGNDTAAYMGAPTGVTVDLARGEASGGFGVDRLAEIESAIGSAKDDTLLGDAADNRLHGGPGRDALDGGEGDDTLSGGLGIDVVRYTDADGPVLASLRLRRSTGADGSDEFISIEDLTGSRHDDYLIGNAWPNHLDGGPGDDVVRGLAGDDVIDGREGLDVAHGGAGVDRCTGEATRRCEPKNPEDSKNCSDFLTQRHAQTWFDAFFAAYGDVARLDADGNGLACESLGG